MKIKIKVREYDGYHYLIPNTKVDSFDLLTKLHSESKIGTDEEEELFTKIDYEFGDYRIDDLNEEQLYRDK